MMIRSAQMSITVVLWLLMAACQPGVSYHETQTVSSEGWDYRDGILFEAEISDTLALHELYLDVRNTIDYPYSNLFLFMEIEFPDNRTLHDTIECVLADSRGEWTGRGIGQVRSNRFLFRDEVWFPVAGTYTFRIQHGMRDTELEGLSDLGIRIKKK